MKFKDKLKKLKACSNSLKWVGNKTIEEAWKTCKESQWMIWILSRTDLDLTDPICDIAEGVLYLVPKDSKAVCRRAIRAARRRANKNELNAAYKAAVAAANVYGDNDLTYASYAAVNSIYAAASCCDFNAISCANYAFSVFSVFDSIYAGSYEEEMKRQCNILRKYFTIEQVREAFNKLVA